MSLLIYLIVGLVIIGLVLYILNFLPIDAAMKAIIRAVVIVFVLIWLLVVLFGNGSSFHLPRG
jgi:hypothetical protein